jgi:hypothetical protein
MRYYVFLTLTGAALVLDAFLLGLSVLHTPRPSRVESSVVLAAPPNTLQPTKHPTVKATAASRPTSTSTPTATAAPTATPTATATPLPTATPEPPPRLLAEHAASFTPGDRAVRTNIRLALNYYHGALTHVFVAPGGTFSFNAALGVAPQRLPWKYVTLKQSVVIPSPAPEGATPAPPVPEERRRIQGGGLCDLASRYVMAARPMLPARAFRFVNHIRSSGIRLQGVPARDSVSIWAVGRQPGEQDLKITNVTDGWLEFIVERDGEKITVRARLWDRLPPP